MSTPTAETAMVVTDVQNSVTAGAHQRDAAIANISTIVGADGVPVVWGSSTSARSWSSSRRPGSTCRS